MPLRSETGNPALMARRQAVELSRLGTERAGAGPYPRVDLVASLSNGQVITIDTDNGHVRNVVTIRGAVLDNTVFDAAGRLFVSDSDAGAVYRISKGRGSVRSSRAG